MILPRILYGQDVTKFQWRGEQNHINLYVK